MTAVFKKTHYILFFVFFILACLFAALFLYMFTQEKLGDADIAVLYTVLAIICAFGVIPLLYNFKAFLTVQNGKIIGRFGFFRQIEKNLSDVVFTMAQVDALYIVFNDKKYNIMGLKNPYQISAYIKQQLPFSPRPVTEDTLTKANERKNTLNKNLILIFCMIALTFLWIIIAVPFIGESKEFSDFTNRDWTYFSLLCFLELPTIFGLFFFALRTRKDALGTQKELYEIKRSLIESTPLPSFVGQIEAVLVDVEFFRRITVVSGLIENHENAVYFNIEQLDKNFDLKFVYQSEIFENKDCVLPHFEGLLDITERYIQ